MFSMFVILLSASDNSLKQLFKYLIDYLSLAPLGMLIYVDFAYILSS